MHFTQAAFVEAGTTPACAKRAMVTLDAIAPIAGRIGNRAHLEAGRPGTECRNKTQTPVQTQAMVNVFLPVFAHGLDEELAVPCIDLPLLGA